MYFMLSEWWEEIVNGGPTEGCDYNRITFNVMKKFNALYITLLPLGLISSLC